MTLFFIVIFPPEFGYFKRLPYLREQTSRISRITFHEPTMLINSFLTYLRCELNYSAHTVLSYSRDISQFADFITGGDIDSFDAVSCRSNDVRAWVLQLSEEGISHRSIRRKVSALSSFFRYLMRRGLTKENPASDVALARPEQKLPVFIRPAEIEEILDTHDSFASTRTGIGSPDFEEIRNDLIVLMLYSTGIRLAEIISLLDENVDTSRRELKVLGKRNKERIIPFGDELAFAIGNYRNARLRVTGQTRHREFFIRPDGQPLYPMLVERVVKKSLTGHTLASRLSPHTLRHSFASDMLNNGADITSVQQLLGHKSLATTQVYTHITYRELQQNYKLAHPRAQKNQGG